MNLNKRIARSIDLSGFSQTELAKMLNITQDILSNWVRGVVKNPKIDILVKLAEICKVDLKWLLTGKGEMVKSEPIKYGQEDLTLIPILGNIPAGGLCYSEEIREGYIPYMEKEVPKQVFALKIYGDSMEPELYQNDIVICKPIGLLEIKQGDIVAIRIHTDTTVKCLFKHKKEYLLVALNKKYPPTVINPNEIESIAKVIMNIRIKKYEEEK